jgi:hypothetical protein
MSDELQFVALTKSKGTVLKGVFDSIVGIGHGRQTKVRRTQSA